MCNHIAIEHYTQNAYSKQTKQTEISDFNTWFPHVQSSFFSLHVAAAWCFLSSKNLILLAFFNLLVAFCSQCRFRKNMVISVEEEAYRMKADILLSGFVWILVNPDYWIRSRISAFKYNHCKNLGKKERELSILIQKNQFSTKEFPVGVLNFIFRLQKGETFSFVWISTMTSACRNYCTSLFLIALNTSEWKTRQHKHWTFLWAIERCVCVCVRVECMC